MQKTVRVHDIRKIHKSNNMNSIFKVFVRILCLCICFWCIFLYQKGIIIRFRTSSIAGEIMEYTSGKYNYNVSVSKFDGVTETRIVLNKMMEENNKTVISPHDYKYLINEETICASNPFMLVFIHTAPKNNIRRNMIRKTWGSVRSIKDYRIELIFLLGVALNRSTNDDIVQESKQYHDIIQENFIESYRNLTLKGIMGLKWTIDFCPHATFILKTDDDVFVNIYPLFDYLLKINKDETGRHNLLGFIRPPQPPARKSNLNTATKEEYARDMYPPFCNGLAFIYSMSAVKAIYKASLYEPFFWIDDVFITGVLAEKAGVKHTQLKHKYPSYLLTSSDVTLNTLKGDKDRYLFVLIHDLQRFPSRMDDFWKILRLNTTVDGQ
ncbi:unnamed protein product [Owenia fusiformis]|uniref:Hexosyltransferase n=1 Tax=Owenia fusiformis TaxID=6347 RepID=A0A8J1U0V5_OWEFU|nr:unnamed protein product [Owenia fusiformis]